jgi:hypothetical protein
MALFVERSLAISPVLFRPLRNNAGDDAIAFAQFDGVSRAEPSF